MNKLLLATLCILSGCAQQQRLSAPAPTHVPPCQTNDPLHTKSLYPNGCEVPGAQAARDFTRITLADLAEQYNQLNKTPHFVIEGNARDIILSGHLRMDQPEDFAAILERGDPTIIVKREGDQIFVKHAGPLPK